MYDEWNRHPSEDPEKSNETNNETRNETRNETSNESTYETFRDKNNIEENNMKENNKNLKTCGKRYSDLCDLTNYEHDEDSVQKKSFLIIRNKKTIEERMKII